MVANYVLFFFIFHRKLNSVAHDVTMTAVCFLIGGNHSHGLPLTSMCEENDESGR